MHILQMGKLISEKLSNWLKFTFTVRKGVEPRFIPVCLTPQTTILTLNYAVLLHRKHSLMADTIISFVGVYPLNFECSLSSIRFYRAF